MAWTYLMDMDGVLVHEEHLIPGADKLIEECASLVAGRARDADIELDYSIVGHVQPLQIDLLAAKQILLNLLTNAVKYTPGGDSVKVTAFADGGDMVCIEVKDTGKLFGAHGGVLDRLDAVLFTIPVAYYAAVGLGYAS